MKFPTVTTKWLTKEPVGSNTFTGTAYYSDGKLTRYSGCLYFPDGSYSSCTEFTPNFQCPNDCEYMFIDAAHTTAYRDYSPHDVDVVKGSKLYDMAGELLQNVPSWHHQSLLSVDGTPLMMSGYTVVNGMKMIEAIEHTDKTLAMGFQFHPEAAVVKHLTGAANKDRFMSMDEAKGLIVSFIDCVKARKLSQP